MFEYKPDFEEVLGRYEAWWECEIVDRPLVSIKVQRPESERLRWPVSEHATLRERWMDTEYEVERARAGMHNTIFCGDALPVVIANLGPEIFSAFYGMELEFGETTSWGKPILRDLSEESIASLKLDKTNEYYKKILEITDALVEAAAGKFIVGCIDLHGGGDAIAAFRDPEGLLLDTIEHPEEIRKLVDRMLPEYLETYDMFYEKLSAAGMPSTTWLAGTCRGKYYVPSNDFSCMISDESFEDLFIPGIIEECRHMDRNIYHLDGPQALRFLDRLLDIPEIHAIQWVPGAGRDFWADQLSVYRRIQERGKAFITEPVPVNELPRLFEELAPEGVWIGGITGVETVEQADDVLKTIASWTERG